MTTSVDNKSELSSQSVEPLPQELVEILESCEQSDFSFMLTVFSELRAVDAYRYGAGFAKYVARSKYGLNTKEFMEGLPETYETVEGKLAFDSNPATIREYLNFTNELDWRVKKAVSEAASLGYTVEESSYAHRLMGKLLSCDRVSPEGKLKMVIAHRETDAMLEEALKDAE